MIFDKGAKTIQWEKDTLSLLGQLDIHMQKNEFIFLPYSIPPN